MITIKQDLTKPSLNVGRDADIVAFTISYILDKIIVTPASTTLTSIGDSSFEQSTPSTYYNGGRLLVNNSLDNNTFNDLTTSIATTDDDGFIIRVSEGTARFSYTEQGVTKYKDVDLTDKMDGSVVTTWLSADPSSLAVHASNEVDSRLLSSYTMATNGRLFTTQNHSTSTYVRNSNFWGSDIDLTCISPWNSNGGTRKAGTAVTKRHVVNAAHYEYSVGTTLRFVTSDNQVVTRTVTGKKRHPDYSPYYPDLTIYTLDSDLPDSITPCKLMPSNFGNYLTEDNIRYTRPPALGLDQEEKGLIIDLYRNNDTSTSFSTPTDSNRLIFNESKIVGDSGNPAFLIVNGELVLLTLWTYGGAGSGTAISGQISKLNEMIGDSDTQAGVSTGYTVTEADFSAFPTY